jgi:hypothetical protein
MGMTSSRDPFLILDFRFLIYTLNLKPTIEIPQSQIKNIFRVSGTQSPRQLAGDPPECLQSDAGHSSL